MRQTGKPPKLSVTKAATYFMLALGILLVAISAFNASSFLAILGVAIVFWGAILLYITPAKHVPLALMNAAVTSATGNIETTLAKSDLREKGRYLPPNLLKDFESSLIFIPQYTGQPLPTPEQASEENMLSPNQNILLLTPPGLGLSKLFEKELGASFTRTNLDALQQKLPKLLVEDMELAQNAELTIQNDTAALEVTGNVLKGICEETSGLTRTHSQVGCLLSSAVACALAKASGKLVTIQKETSTDTGATRIEFQLEAVDSYVTAPNPPGKPAAEAAQQPKLETAPEPQPKLPEPKTPQPKTSLKRADVGSGAVLDAEVDAHALSFLEDNGDVFILVDVENPQFTYSRIKYYDVDLSVRFEEFLEICKSPHSENALDAQGTEFATETFKVTSPAAAKSSNIEFYLSKSGFSTVNDWLKTLNPDKIPECTSTNRKTFYLYHVTILEPIS